MEPTTATTTDVATVIDSDYAYIGTFLNFLNKLVDIMDKMFGGLIEKIGQLLAVLPQE